MPDTLTAPAPAAPTSTSTPAPPSPKAESSPFSALDTRARTLPTKKEPEAPKEPVKESDDLKEAFEEPKPTAEKKPDAAKTEKPTAQVNEPPRVLREKLTAREKELEISNKELKTLREKISEYDKKNIDTTTLSERLTAREKEFLEIKAERDAAKYERSDEFKNKFEKPFTNAANYAQKVVEALKVNEADAEGNITQRPATWDDFAVIYRMPPARAELMARQMFGDNFSVVMRHLDKLRELDHNKEQALQEYQSTASERENQSKAEQAQQREKVNQAWEMTNKDVMESNPDWFGEKKDDEEGNAIWKESLALVDQAYSGRDKLSFQQQVQLDANIRLRAAAFPRILRENEQLKAQLAEFNEKREQHENSLPGKVRKATSGESTNTETDWRTDLRKSVPIDPG